jgi:hypothetical protein
VRDSGFAERTCLREVSNESLLAWDRSDLLRGPWEDSFEERRDPGASDGVLFSPERKEVSGGMERGRWSEDEDLFSPVRLRFGRLTANDQGSAQRENGVGCHARARARKGDAERGRDEWSDDSADRPRISGGGRRRKSDRK